MALGGTSVGQRYKCGTKFQTYLVINGLISGLNESTTSFTAPRALLAHQSFAVFPSGMFRRTKKYSQLKSCGIEIVTLSSILVFNVNRLTLRQILILIFIPFLN